MFHKHIAAVASAVRLPGGCLLASNLRALTCVKQQQSLLTQHVVEERVVGAGPEEAQEAWQECQTEAQ